ncbi:autotransporter outer membrane beta-barrel domain-containing protein [Burkholderia sp. 4701]|nr:autotransporter outer membrane beta-barrel domain-containing protein [Burkholderia sp. 4701]MXN80517.1 autotransporter outer membrane beta-barrel domain-containing protein [Burkholderia sp. 4812]
MQDKLQRAALIAGAVLPFTPFAPFAQAATGGAQHADGIVLEIASGDYATTDSARHVLYANHGGVLTTAGKVRLSSAGFSAAGAYADGVGSRIALDGAQIRTTNMLGVGLQARFGGLVSARDVTIDTEGRSGHGLYIDNGLPDGSTPNRIDFAGGTIRTHGREAAGIMINHAPGSSINVTDAQVRTTGDLANGMFLGYGDVGVTLERVDLGTAGDFASAVNMPGQSTATIRDSHLRTEGDMSLGVDTRAGYVELARTRVLTHGASAHGLYASMEYAATPAVHATDTDVVTTGNRSIGALARRGGQVALSGGSIETFGERSYGLFASGANSLASLSGGTLVTHGAGAAAVYASTLARVELRNTVARATGDGAWGAVVTGGSLAVDGGSLASERHGAIGAADATIALKNGARVTGGNGTLMSVDAAADAPVSLSLDGNAYAVGNIVNLPDDDGHMPPAVTDVALSNGSTWRGASDAVRTLSLDGGSNWHVTGDSTIGSLSLNDSAITFAPPSLGAFRSLVVAGDFAARHGRIVVNTVLGDDTSPSDRLVIDGGRASGDTAIVVRRAGGDGAQTTVGIPIVETRNGGTTAASAFALDAASDGYRQGFGTLSAGGYDYMLKRGGHGGKTEDWHLVSAAKPEPPVDPAPPVDPEPPVNPETVPPPRAAAPEPDAYLANADAAAMMAIHTLHQREDRSLRSAEAGSRALDGAVWLRAEGQFTSISGGARSVSGNGRLIHAGADLLRFDDGRGGNVRLGAMGMYGSQTSWSTRALWNAFEQRVADATARGSVSGYNVGLYGTWYGNRDILAGPYVDAWFMYGAYANSVGGSLAADSYRSRTVTGSLETGYSFRFYERGDTRFYVEPEAQLVVSGYRADAHDTSGGRLDGQSSTDVLTRIGVRVHGVTAIAPGRELRPFIEMNWWHGPGSRSLTLDGNAFSFSVPRDRAAFRVGATGQLSKRFAVSAGLGLEANLSDYTVVKGDLAVKYRW